MKIKRQLNGVVRGNIFEIEKHSFCVIAAFFFPYVVYALLFLFITKSKSLIQPETPTTEF